jgi:hypothetical protein
LDFSFLFPVPILFIFLFVFGGVDRLDSKTANQLKKEK